MGEVIIRRESRPECVHAFLFVLGHRNAAATGLGRDSSTGKSLLTPGVPTERFTASRKECEFYVGKNP
jgi:hypothetical protein